jgi:hypothetical protein
MTFFSALATILGWGVIGGIACWLLGFILVGLAIVFGPHEEPWMPGDDQ